MKRKRGLVILLLIALTLSGCAAVPLVYDEKQSTMIGDFFVGNGKATVECSITVTNKSDSPVSFRMKGDFAEDQAIGLFKGRYVYAYAGSAETSSTNGDIFQIEAKSRQEYDVYFIGPSGGKEQKTNRLPPNNVVFEIQNEK